MALILDDHGLEVIRKSGEVDPSLEPHNYRIRTKITNTSAEAIPVYSAQSPTEELISVYANQSAVASATEITVVSYTVPIGKVLYLQLVECSGENIARYAVQIDATTIAQRRTWFSGGLNTDFIFVESENAGLEIAAGSVVRLRAEHNRPNVGDIDGWIVGVLDDA